MLVVTQTKLKGRDGLILVGPDRISRRDAFTWRKWRTLPRSRATKLFSGGAWHTRYINMPWVEGEGSGVELHSPSPISIPPQQRFPLIAGKEVLSLKNRVARVFWDSGILRNRSCGANVE